MRRVLDIARFSFPFPQGQIKKHRALQSALIACGRQRPVFGSLGHKATIELSPLNLTLLRFGRQANFRPAAAGIDVQVSWAIVRMNLEAQPIGGPAQEFDRNSVGIQQRAICFDRAGQDQRDHP